MNDALRQYALEAAKGNTDAAQFLLDMVSVLHFWDDLVDRDKPVDDATIDDRFFTMLVALPRNPFYQAHFAALNTTLTTAIANWHAATRMERGTDDYAKSIAFILRSSYVDLVTQVAFITGGPDWAAQISHRVHWFAHQETYEGYLKNLDAERQAREGGPHVL